MKRRMLLALGMGVAAGRALGQRMRFSASLRGAEQSPPNQSRATGKAIFAAKPDETSVQYEVVGTGLRNVSGVSLHLGERGTNGPVVVELLKGPAVKGDVNGALANGVIEAQDLTGPMVGGAVASLVAEMRAGKVYVNVRTDDGAPPAGTGPGDYPSGEIRGQVR